MMAIFSDFCEKIVEVFMDDFSVYGTSSDDCLSNLDLVLQRSAILWLMKALSWVIKFLKEVLKWTKLRLMQLKKCHVQIGRASCRERV